MLEPDIRQLLLDALRPPPGFTLEGAFGTTFSLDLMALMTAPLAFAMFDRQKPDGSEHQDPIALLQALRSHADRITIFCQAGQIAVPHDYRSLYVYLEPSVFPVIPPHPASIFHPKVWYLKFVHPVSHEVRYRLLCLSRNLTFDRSWDTVLQLDGVPSSIHEHLELEEFGRSLIDMATATTPLPAARASAIRGIAREFAHAHWDLPEGFQTIRFWPLGHDGAERDPFAGRRDRMLVISPFVTPNMLARLTKPRENKGSLLVTRPETFEQLGGNATAHLAERLVLGSGINDPNADEIETAADEALAESVNATLDGLHAKCYVADAGWDARLWTGSANCTEAAFHGNVEFLVELTGSKQRCSVQAVLGDESNRLGLRKLLEPYTPENPDGQVPSSDELAKLRMENVRRAIGSMAMTARCTPRDDDRWSLRLQAMRPLIPIDTNLADISVTLRPATLEKGAAQLIESIADGFEVAFVVSEKAITPHFAVQLELDGKTIDFLMIAPLTGAPDDRAERVLADLLKNRADVLRFLLLLLGNVDAGLDAFVPGASGGIGIWALSGKTDALLEPLVTAFARDPQRIRDIATFVAELRRNESATNLLPEQWDEIWEPIAAAMPPQESPA